ncbi:LysR family transcriptional regulator [Enterobacteriaceae bacterium BIT-l23]|uniref:LysR family transcriptional regulator n=1 Tax=Jejubacter calystegiae TaxID=2579935 RepID=A0A4P8YCV0_9ENTR|nr:LysR family transcriptional regulator [Jejubacter calystegiae]NUU66733.1 LysR family transcriptional regulator [Enterobacteriaceae bacterium BIT-l23]QCT18385.1 LysR family transcriptional regulator [Jejubacter calystegiae]
MELRYLRYFIAVAQNKNFSRAAESLGISQPPLSQQIQRLEREVGTPLLHRLTRSVELTEAGRNFYEDACKIIALSDAALEKAKGIARGVNGKLYLGVTSSNAFHPKIFSTIYQFHKDYPNVALYQKEANMATLMHELDEGRIDAAFVRLPCDSSQFFNLRMIAREQMLVGLHHSHPLARQAELSLDELTGTPVIIFPQEVAPGLYELIYQTCQQAGINMDNKIQASQFSSSISMVAAGFGFAFIPESMTCFQHPHITFHQIKKSRLKTDVALAWRKFERSPTVKQFIGNF